MLKKFSLIFMLLPLMLVLFSGIAIASEADRFGLPVQDNKTVINKNNTEFRWNNDFTELLVIFNGNQASAVTAKIADVTNSAGFTSYYYEIEGWTCDNTIIREISNNRVASDASSTDISVDIDFRKTDLDNCQDTSENVIDFETTNPKAGNTYFRWIDSSTIESIDPNGSPNTFVRSNSKPEIFVRESENGDGECQDRIVVDTQNDSLIFYELDDKYRGDTPQSAGTNCNYNENSVPPGNIELFILNENSNKTLAAGTGQSTDSTEQDNESCEDNDGEFVFFQCAIIEFASGVVNFADSKITSSLEINSAFYLNPDLREAWSSFRNIAYLILIPVLLVMVIGTALGFSFLDAYTVKRALPRLLFAVIFIALSYEICIFIIQTVNIIGNGIGGLIAAPFGGMENLELTDIFNPSGLSGGAALGIGVIGGITAVGIGAVGLGILGSYLLVAGLALIIIFGLLVMREVIIVFLIILAPIAIISWIFPNNDKAWKLWWNTFSKLLLLYPIIVGVLVTGRAFASIISDLEVPAEGVEQVFLTFTKLVAFIGPFFLIPTIFRYAGGAFANLAGLVNNRSKGLFDRSRKYRAKSRAQGWDRKGRSRVVQTRADWQNRLQQNASKGGYIRRKSLGGLATAVGGYNAQADDSARRGEMSKRIAEQTGNGRDDEVRALTVNRKAADASTQTTAGQLIKQADGSFTQAGLSEAEQKVRITADGNRQYRTLGGAWVESAAVDAAYSRWGKDTYAQQAALSYEMKKALTVDDHKRVSSQYASLATEAWGQTGNQAAGTWIGAAYENQGEKLEFKHTNWQDGKINAKKFSQELYEKRGSYQMSQMTASNFEILEREYLEAQQKGDTQTQQQIQAIAETFMSRMEGGGAIQGMEGDIPIARPQATTGQQQTGSREIYRTNSAGPAHTSEAIRRLAVTTGVYGPLDPNTDTRSSQTNINQPRQN